MPQTNPRDIVNAALAELFDDFVELTDQAPLPAFTVSAFYTEYVSYCKILNDLAANDNKPRCRRYLDFAALLFLMDNKVELDASWEKVTERQLSPGGTSHPAAEKIMLNLATLVKNTFARCDTILPAQMYNYLVRQINQEAKFKELVSNRGVPKETRLLALGMYLSDNLTLTQAPTSDYVDDTLMEWGEYREMLTVWLAFVMDNCIAKRSQTIALDEMNGFLQYYTVPPNSVADLLANIGPEAVKMWPVIKTLDLNLEAACAMLLSPKEQAPAVSLPTNTAG